MLDFVAYINATSTASADVKQRFLVDFTDQHGYETQLPTGLGGSTPNPVSRKDFANTVILNFLKDSVRAQRHKAAVQTVVVEELELD